MKNLRILLEQYVTVDSIKKEVINRINKGEQSVITNIINNSIQEVEIKHVFQAAAAGDKLCLEIINNTVEFLSISIVNLILTLDPQIIVIGGEISNQMKIHDLFLDPIIKKINKSLALNIPKIILSKLGEEAGIIGATFHGVNLILMEEFPYDINIVQKIDFKRKDKVDCLTFDIREILNNSKIKVYLVEDKLDIYNDIARVMANKLKENNDKEIKTSFILPVGPRGQYQRFARICNLEKISCKNLITINMDEYLTDNENYIAEDNPLSFRGFMKKNFFNILDNELKIKIENIFFPDPKNTNEINEVIDQIGGVDTAFGGVGINGHIAFNEPIDEKIILHNEFRNLKT